VKVSLAAAALEAAAAFRDFFPRIILPGRRGQRQRRLTKRYARAIACTQRESERERERERKRETSFALYELRTHTCASVALEVFPREN